MIEKIGNVTLDLEAYCGKDLYSDGEIEDTLLDIAKTHNEEELNQVIKDQYSWPVLYHFSHIRQNIITWLPITKKQSVLEIGAGCGAITGALASMAGDVTCVELSKKRSLINANRNRKHNNITIKVGNYTDVEKTLKQYDVITLIGVFEYAECYVDAKEPYIYFLQNICKHLKPGGELIIAIENRLGMKYLSGCMEDHTSLIGEGLKNYPSTSGVHTFERSELEEVFQKAGISAYKFYYPYPDYKLPLQIYSDEYLPKCGELRNNYNNLDQERVEIFKEDEAFDFAIKNGIFPQLSNSYLVRVFQDTVKEGELETIYSKYSNDRSAEYAIRTDIIEDKNHTKYICKVPMSEAAKSHVDKLSKYEAELTKLYADTVLEPNKLIELKDRKAFEFVKGKCLTDILDAKLEESEEEFFALFDEYAALLEQVVGETTNVDLITDNIIVDGDKWTVIDYEWTVERKLDSRFILYRTLHYYLSGSKARGTELTAEKLYTHFGYDEKERLKWYNEEEKFQKGIDGNYHKLATIKYEHNKNLLDINQLLSGSGKEEKVYKARYELEDGTSGEIAFSRNGLGECILHIPLEHKTNSILVSLMEEVALVHVKSVMGRFEEKEFALDYSSNATPLGGNVIRMFEGEWIKVSLADIDVKEINFVFNIQKFDEANEAAFVYGTKKDAEEKQQLREKITELERQLATYEKLIEVASLRQEQILQLRDTKSIYYMGRCFDKMKHYDPIMALRPPLSVEESGIRFFIDEVQYRNRSLFIRGWAFQDLGHKVSVRVRDEKGKRIEAYVRKIERDDVAEAFNVPVDTICGFAISVSRSFIKTEKIYLEFETMGGYISKEIMAYGRKKDREKREELLQNPMDYRIEYDEWTRENRVTEKELKRQRKTRFEYQPLISVVVPLFNTPIDYLETMISSVLHQTYSNVQLCLADGSTEDNVGEYIKEHYGLDLRVKYKRLAENKGISGNTIEAVNMADGEFLMLCDHDDEVMLNACYEMVKALNSDEEIDAVYTDEDKMTMDGEYFFDPHFKPDFNLEFLRGNNYICHIFLIRKSIVDSLGVAFRTQFDGAQDFDFILRCCEKARKVYHVPKVVYHWRSHPLSTAGNPESKDYAYEAGRASVAASYERAGLKAKVTRTEFFGRYRTEFDIVGNPKVSIVMAVKEKEADAGKVKENVEALYKAPGHNNFEVILVSNDQKLQKTDKIVKLIKAKHELDLPALYNRGAKEASGEYILFMDSMVKAFNENWLKEMLSYCQLSDVAACGCKLLKSEDKIWAAGLVIGMYGLVGKAFENVSVDEFSYAGWARSTRDVSALSGKAMLVKKEVFEKSEGFDVSMSDALYDSDWCLKMNDQGYRTIYNPYAEMIVGDCDSVMASDDVREAFKQRWNKYFQNGDPYFNPNFSVERSDCELKEL